jgi:hypothetical protein
MKSFIIFLGGNFKQLPYLKNIKEKNYNVILIDQNINCPGRKYSDFFFKSSYTDKKKLYKIYLKIKKINISHIFTASAHFAHIGGSYLAKKLKINYPVEKNIKICLDKKLFYPFFKKNGINIPKTYLIKNKIDLKKKLKTLDYQKNYFLKSDYSKSPNYIYDGLPKDLLNKKINWKKNQFFKSKYILQERFLGKNLRVNIYQKKFEIYNFFSGKKIPIKKILEMKKFKIIKKFQRLAKKLNMKNWLIKFDLIVNKKEYVALDIGLSPPHRMKLNWEKSNKNFIDFYLKLYISNF